MKPDVWLYCEKCASSYRPTYWCACWDTGYAFPFDDDAHLRNTGPDKNGG